MATSSRCVFFLGLILSICLSFTSANKLLMDQRHSKMHENMASTGEGIGEDIGIGSGSGSRMGVGEGIGIGSGSGSGGEGVGIGTGTGSGGYGSGYGYGSGSDSGYPPENEPPHWGDSPCPPYTQPIICQPLYPRGGPLPYIGEKVSIPLIQPIFPEKYWAPQKPTMMANAPVSQHMTKEDRFKAIMGKNNEPIPAMHTPQPDKMGSQPIPLHMAQEGGLH